MKTNFVLFLTFLLLQTLSYGQQFSGLDHGLNHNVRGLYGDEASGTLWVAGHFTKAGNTDVAYFGRWKKNQWDSTNNHSDMEY